jgi:hypothetical protein
MPGAELSQRLRRILAALVCELTQAVRTDTSVRGWQLECKEVYDAMEHFAEGRADGVESNGAEHDFSDTNSSIFVLAGTWAPFADSELGRPYPVHRPGRYPSVTDNGADSPLSGESVAGTLKLGCFAKQASVLSCKYAADTDWSPRPGRCRTYPIGDCRAIRHLQAAPVRPGFATEGGIAAELTGM